MDDAATRLHVTAEDQIGQMIALLAQRSDAELRQPCAGREKLGDGTIAAAVSHLADNYGRIAGFVQTSGQMSHSHAPGAKRGHRMPRFLGAFGHRPPEHAAHGAGSHAGEHGPGSHGSRYAAESFDRDALLSELVATRESLKLVGQLTDAQLATVPPDGSFRFCDGKRTLGEVLSSLLKHQAHQLAAIVAQSP